MVLKKLLDEMQCKAAGSERQPNKQANGKGKEQSVLVGSSKYMLCLALIASCGLLMLRPYYSAPLFNQCNNRSDSDVNYALPSCSIQHV